MNSKRGVRILRLAIYFLILLFLGIYRLKCSRAQQRGWRRRNTGKIVVCDSFYLVLFSSSCSQFSLSFYGRLECLIKNQTNTCGCLCACVCVCVCVYACLPYSGELVVPPTSSFLLPDLTWPVHPQHSLCSHPSPPPPSPPPIPSSSSSHGRVDFVGCETLQFSYPFSFITTITDFHSFLDNLYFKVYNFPMEFFGVLLSRAWRRGGVENLWII